jgi:hypothetical protein
MTKEKQTSVSDVFAEVCFGISFLLIFCFLWIPMIVLLIKEYNWIAH